jgi:DNA invertase Pin-like site-specific DNA recombinase
LRAKPGPDFLLLFGLHAVPCWHQIRLLDRHSSLLKRNREKVDTIVRLIDQYLAEEAIARNLQSDKQTIHPRDLPPEKREALINEIYEILGDARKG